MTEIELVEKELAAHFNRRHAILCGRGATALWAIFSTLTKDRDKIIVPATLCLSPVFSALYADKTPVFCDVTPSGNLDIQKAKKIIENDPKIGAVLAVHLYGIPLDIDELASTCVEHDVLIVEDVCQAMGGTNNSGNLLGSDGKISVFSFGHTKILDLGGGGAILTDDSDYAEQLRISLSSVKEEDSSSLSSAYRDLFYPIWNAGRTASEFYRFFHLFPETFKPMYFKNIPPELPQKLLSALPLLNGLVDQRNTTAKLYNDHLRDIPTLRTLSQLNSGVVWRYTIAVPSEQRNSLVKVLRENGHDASTWYPCIANWFSSSEPINIKESDFHNAFALEKEIINLWVSPDYDEEKIANVAHIIKQHPGIMSK